MHLEIAYLKGLEERIEVDEDDLGDLILSRVDKEKHVGDAEQRQQDKSGLHCFPITRPMERSQCLERLAQHEMKFQGLIDYDIK